jgi:hypothetical protein
VEFTMIMGSGKMVWIAQLNRQESVSGS